MENPYVPDHSRHIRMPSSFYQQRLFRRLSELGMENPCLMFRDSFSFDMPIRNTGVVISFDIRWFTVSLLRDKYVDITAGFSTICMPSLPNSHSSIRDMVLYHAFHEQTRFDSMCNGNQVVPSLPGDKNYKLFSMVNQFCPRHRG